MLFRSGFMYLFNKTVLLGRHGGVLAAAFLFRLALDLDRGGGREKALVLELDGV